MKKNLVYGFLDESPSLHDKTFFFCVDIVSTTKKTNKKLQKILKKARKRIVKKKLKSVSELKFYHSNEKTRFFILSELAKQDVEIVVLIIDKQKRRIKDTPSNYGIVVGAAVAELLSIHPALSLTVDKKYTSKNQQKEFQQASQETINKLVIKRASVFFNPPVDSQKESVVQLADFVAGAFHFKYNRQDDHYAKIIKNKIKIEKVMKWTELKKRIVNP